MKIWNWYFNVLSKGGGGFHYINQLKETFYLGMRDSYTISTYSIAITEMQQAICQIIEEEQKINFISFMTIFISA